MPPPFNLGSLLQPFNQQSPINLIAMIAQAGLQNPEALAGVLASQGAPVPTGVAGAAAPRPPPTPSPTPAPGVPGQAPGKLEGVLEAVSKLKAPPLPELAAPPAAIRPGPGGPAPNPALLAALMQLLQGGAGQAQAIPTLGQLIAGGGSATAPATLSL